MHWVYFGLFAKIKQRSRTSFWSSFSLYFSSMKMFFNTFSYYIILTQPAFTCSKLTMETLEQGVKDVQN